LPPARPSCCGGAAAGASAGCADGLDRGAGSLALALGGLLLLGRDGRMATYGAMVAVASAAGGCGFPGRGRGVPPRQASTGRAAQRVRVGPE
jgi:hypothetical protein